MAPQAKILVVDPSARRRSTCLILERAGYGVASAASGEEALALARQHRPDVILLDARLCDGQGRPWCQRLKADPALAGTIVALLADSIAFSEQTATGLEPDADSTIPCPTPSRDLVARVQTLVRLQQAEAAVRMQARQLERQAGELAGLRAVAMPFGRPGSSLDEILRHAAGVLPPAMRYGDLAGARIVLDGRECQAGRFHEDGRRLAHDILVSGRPAGRVEVSYPPDSLPEDEAPFSTDERDLIQTVAQRLARAVEWLRAEQAVSESVATARALLHNPAVLVLLLQPDGVILDANRALADRLGQPVEALIGRPAWDLFSSEISQARKAALAQVIETGQVLRMEETHGHSLFDTVFEPILDPQGRVTRVAVIARDITGRMRMEEALQYSEQKLRGLVTWSQQGISLVDEWGRLIEWNSALERITGLAAADALGRQVWDVQMDLTPPGERTPERRRELEQSARAALRTGQAPWAGRPVEQRIQTQDGQLRSVENVTFPIPTDKGYMLGTISGDVTDRVRAAEALRLNEARLNSLLELNQKAAALSEQQIIAFGLEEMVRLTRSDIGYFHFVNPDQNTLQLIAWSAKTLKTCTARHDSHYPLSAAGVWADSVRLKAPVVHNDYQGLPGKKGYPDGHSHLIRHLGVCALDQGRVVAVAGVGNKETDYEEIDARQVQLLADSVWRIVQRRRAEEKVQASLREKEVLLKEIHHRVKNNLQVISSLLDMQSLYVTDPAAVDLLQESRNRVRAMSAVHERLYQSADLMSINLGEYLDGITQHLFATYGSQAPGVRRKTEADTVFLDIDTAIPCGLIVNELVSNALRHAFPASGGQGGEIRVQVHRKDEGWLALTVRDNGVGLPPDLDVETIPSLGLRLVTMLTRQLRGTVHFERNGGTTVQVSFPLRKTPPPVAHYYNRS